MRFSVATTLPAVLLLAGCGTTVDDSGVDTGGDVEPVAVTPAEPEDQSARLAQLWLSWNDLDRLLMPAAELPRSTTPVHVGEPSDPELPFEPSDRDRPRIGTGFTGVVDAPTDGSERALRIAAVRPDGPLGQAGLQDGDLILAADHVRFAKGDDDPIGGFREHLLTLRPGDPVKIVWWREGEGVSETMVELGRAAAFYAPFETREDWLETKSGDSSLLDRAVAASLALDGGRARYEDTLERNRNRLAKTDSLRLRPTVEAHLNPTSQPNTARYLTDGLREAPTPRLRMVPDLRYTLPEDEVPQAMAALRRPRAIDELIAELSSHVQALRAAQGWTDEERAYFDANFHRLSERMLAGEYLHDDPDVERQRASRRIVALLSRVDRNAYAEAIQRAREWAGELQRALRLRFETEPLADGLLFEQDTPHGRIEVWGGGDQRHTKRCALRIDLAGDDVYRDVGGRADAEVPISINIDVRGDDLYGSTTPFGQGSAIGGIGILIDQAGDDQYLATQWSQGVGVAGHGLLLDLAGDDVYRGQDACQGVGMVGSGLVVDIDGSDTFTGVRFCQGVGLAGGVGAVRDDAGDDRYVCTGRYGSEYGEPGMFSGWGQGCGFGFRHMSSGGIGMLVDGGGADVYEAGNFSQGGAYFHAWGILRDMGDGDDRYIGSRYAQGFAAHQAAGTFLEEGGDDLYQSHSDVAQGLSWDETSVVFVDESGDDLYQTRRGFSLASAAHNGMVIFLDAAGDDTYRSRPGRANSNQYHGGHSFALFLDLGGTDRYAEHAAEVWNDRVHWLDEGAYFLDLPDGDLSDLQRFVRPPETDAK